MNSSDFWVSRVVGETLGTSFEEADLRTLALASPVVTAAWLNRYLDYQRALLAIARRHPTPSPEAAHTEALATSGLPARELPALTALCRDYAGRRATFRRVASRMEQARTQGDQAVVAALQSEISRIADERPLVARYGSGIVDQLREREEPLVELHTALQELELRPRPPAG